MGKKRNMLMCPLQSGAFTPVECDGDKCELWQKAEFVMSKMVKGHCSLYWSGLYARGKVIEKLV